MPELRIGIVDTGVNPWHSHVRGAVSGCRIYLHSDGSIREDAEFSDPVGHGTAVAGVLRAALPAAELFAVRVFDRSLRTYPSLLARGILRAAAAGCRLVNLSLALPPGSSAELIADACRSAHAAGVILVAAGQAQQSDLLPGSLEWVHGVLADNRLAVGKVTLDATAPYRCRANGKPRQLPGIPAAANLSGHSLACARVSAHLTQAIKR